MIIVIVTTTITTIQIIIMTSKDTMKNKLMGGLGTDWLTDPPSKGGVRVCPTSLVCPT